MRTGARVAGEPTLRSPRGARGHRAAATGTANGSVPAAARLIRNALCERWAGGAVGCSSTCTVHLHRHLPRPAAECRNRTVVRHSSWERPLNAGGLDGWYGSQVCDGADALTGAALTPSPFRPENTPPTTVVNPSPPAYGRPTVAHGSYKTSLTLPYTAFSTYDTFTLVEAVR
jgi:hypothetical protein